MPRVSLAWTVALALLAALPFAAAVRVDLDLGLPSSDDEPPRSTSSSSSDPSPITTAAVAGADVTVSKTDSVDPATVGQSFQYNVTVANTGTAAASGVTMRDTLPSGVSLTSTSAPGGWSCSQSGQVVTCTRSGSLAAGASAVIGLTVTADTVGNWTNRANVTSTNEPAGNQGPDNFDNETTTIRTAAPGPLVCFADASGVHIDWANVAQATSYNVYRAVGVSGGSFVFLDSTTVSQYTDTTAAVGQAYRYRVTAVASGIESAPSDPCTIASVPELPTLLAGAAAVVGAVGAMRLLRRRA